MYSGNPGSLHRAVAVMRLLAAAGPRGASLTDLVQRSGLPHPSVHRLLGQLLEERLVRRTESRRYALGVLTFELGLAASPHFDLRALCAPVVTRLAATTGDTAYLTVRSDLEAVCVDRRHGGSPIQVNALEIGSRRPLGVGAGGLAILAAMESGERAEVLDAVSPALEADWGTPPETLRTLVDGCRTAGYALVHNRVVAGVSAVGLAVRDSLGRPIAALSVATLNSTMTTPRLHTLVRLLDDAVREAQAALGSTRRATSA